MLSRGEEEEGSLGRPGIQLGAVLTRVASSLGRLGRLRLPFSGPWRLHDSPIRYKIVSVLIPE